MKKSNRLKAAAIESRAEFDRVVDDLARGVVALRKLEASRDLRLQAIRAEWDQHIGKELERSDALTLLAEKYATEHRAELFPGKEKSDETALATFGFRLGNQSLAAMSRGVTWAGVLVSLKRLRYRRWVRVKEEPAKDLMLAAAKRSPKAAAVLARLGLKIAQAETFFVEAKDSSSQSAAQEALAS